MVQQTLLEGSALIAQYHAVVRALVRILVDDRCQERFVAAFDGRPGQCHIHPHSLSVVLPLTKAPVIDSGSGQGILTLLFRQCLPLIRCLQLPVVSLAIESVEQRIQARFAASVPVRMLVRFARHGFRFKAGKRSALLP